jgi:hypothetical protein
MNQFCGLPRRFNKQQTPSNVSNAMSAQADPNCGLLNMGNPPPFNASMLPDEELRNRAVSVSENAKSTLINGGGETELGFDTK